MTQPSHMAAGNGSGPGEEREISLVEIVNVFLRHRRMLVLVPLLFCGALVLWSLTQERTYRATASFMPQAAERSSSGAASLARQFGLNVGGADRAGQSPQFYADLVRGREVLRQAVESTYQLPASDGRVREATLIDIFEIDAAGAYPPAWRRAVNRLKGEVSASVSRETGVVRLDVTGTDPILAEQIAARLLELLNQFNMETRQSQALAEGQFVAARTDEAQQELHLAEESLKAFLQQNRQFGNSPELVFEHDRLQRQVAMRQEIFASLAQSHEQARIDAVRDTPVITVIAAPSGSAEPQGRGTGRRGVLGLLFGLAIAAFLAFVLDLSRRAREEDEGSYREFSRLKAEALHDLRRPTRLLRIRETPTATAPPQ